MKRILTSLTVLLASMPMMAQGWPAEYEGVMLQAFYWDSFDESQWTELESQANELSQYFTLVWLPQSGNCGSKSMGYDDMYWFPNGRSSYTSSFGTEAELRSLIKTFKEKGIGTIADVVINHRRSNSGWFGFPKETYNGVTYTMGSTDICSDDDGGKAQTEATRLGVSLGAEDTGEGWDGMRDLDHTSENVQNTVKAYLKMLLEGLGYAGFRYDMVKGYAASYTKLYNEYAQPTFSVGEYWDNSSKTRTWIVGTGRTSAAFDFMFKYVVRNATDKSDWTMLGKRNDNYFPMNSMKVSNGDYRRYAITFVENHDTEVRPDGSSNGPLRKDTLAANAYLMAMPGTPCVFLKHWIDCKQDIKAMIDVRNAMGIHNMCDYTEVVTGDKNCYVVNVAGKKGSLICAVGTTAEQYAVESGYTKVLSGYHYAYWMENKLEMPWIDKASGTFSKAFDAVLTAVSQTAGTQLVYTTDGTEPTATNGTKVASGTRISISSTTTLKAGLLVGGKVTSVITREYTYSEGEAVVVPDFCTVSEGEVCAFFEAPASWTKTTCWAWDAYNYTGGSWPGVACTLLGQAANGNNVWKWTFKESDYKGTAGTATMPKNIIFSNNGSSQTADLVFTNGGYYNKKGLQEVVPVTQTVLKGDANGDGTVDVADVVAIVNYILEKPGETFNAAAADVNGDGNIDVGDVVSTVNIILSKE
jgi:alpha-amylase